MFSKSYLMPARPITQPLIRLFVPVSCCQCCKNFRSRYPRMMARSDRLTSPGYKTPDQRRPCSRQKFTYQPYHPYRQFTKSGPGGRPSAPAGKKCLFLVLKPHKIAQKWAPASFLRRKPELIDIRHCKSGFNFYLCSPYFEVAPWQIISQQRKESGQTKLNG